MRRWIAALTCICFTVVGCTSIRKMPVEEYDNSDQLRDKTWEIKTVDGRTYETDRLSRTDSSFVVHTRKRASPGPRFVAIDPVEIPFDQVKSFGSREFSHGRTALLSVFGLCFAVFMLAVAAGGNINLEPVDQ